MYIARQKSSPPEAAEARDPRSGAEVVRVLDSVA